MIKKRNFYKKMDKFVKLLFLNKISDKDNIVNT